MPENMSQGGMKEEVGWRNKQIWKIILFLKRMGIPAFISGNSHLTL